MLTWLEEGPAGLWPRTDPTPAATATCGAGLGRRRVPPDAPHVLLCVFGLTGGGGVGVFGIYYYFLLQNIGLLVNEKKAETDSPSLHYFKEESFMCPGFIYSSRSLFLHLDSLQLIFLSRSVTSRP